jgi:putative transposase
MRLIVPFIAAMRSQHYQVESICRMLNEQGVRVSPRAYRNRKTVPPSARTIDDAHLTDALPCMHRRPSDDQLRAQRHLQRPEASHRSPGR